MISHPRGIPSLRDVIVHHREECERAVAGLAGIVGVEDQRSVLYQQQLACNVTLAWLDGVGAGSEPSRLKGSTN